MAVMYLGIEQFSLKSAWKQTRIAVGTDDYELRVTPPSVASAHKVFGASAIPSGSVIKSALLKVNANEGLGGGKLEINGSRNRDQDVTSLFQQDQDGNYVDFAVSFTYEAYGDPIGVTAGLKTSTCVIRSAVIEVTYEAGEGNPFDGVSFREAALAPVRRIKPRAIITWPDSSTTPVDDTIIIDYEINEGNDRGVLFGTATSAVLEMTLANAGGEWLPGGSIRQNREIYGARITVEIGLMVNESWVFTPGGTFIIEEISGEEGSTIFSITGYDEMSNTMEEKWEDDIAYPATITQILQKISEKSGIGLYGVLACNRAAVIQKKPDWGEESTYRKALSFVCAAGGSYAYITRNGSLGIANAWRRTPTLELGTEHYMSLAHEERQIIFNRLVVRPRGAKNDEDNIVSIVNAAVEELPSNTLYIDDNPLFVKDQAVANEMANGLRDFLTGANWHAVNVRWRGDPSVTIGTRLFLTDRRGVLTETTIMAQSIRWDGGFSCSGRCSIDTKEIFSSGVTGGGMIDTKRIAIESIPGKTIENQGITEDKLADGSIKTAHFKQATIEQLKTDAINAVSAEIKRLAAGEITTDQLYASIATIAAAQITAANIDKANIEWADITSLMAEIADMVNANIGTADIDFARIKDMVTDTAIITKGVGDKLYIARLAVTDANMVSLTAGELIVKGKDGGFYALTVDDAGNVQTERKQVANDDVGDLSINAGEKLIEGSVTAATLDVQDIFADSAIIRGLIAAHIDVDTLFAREATLNAINALDIRGNRYLSISVDGLRQEIQSAADQSGQQMTISFDGGNAIEKEKQSLTAMVHVWKNGVDITDDIPKKAFTWEKDSGQDTDAAWTAANAGKTAVTLTREDIGKSCQLKCTVNAEDSYGRFEIVNGELMWTGEDIFHIANGSLFGPDAYMLKDGSVYIKTAPGKMTVTTTAFDHSVLENSGLSITPGGIHMYTGGTFTLDSDNFRIDENGNVTISGTVTAEEGMIGGWKIGPGSLSSGTGTKHVRLSTEDATYAIWAGAEASGNAPFRVARDGTVYLTRLYVTDENGVAQESPVNLRTSYWKMDKAYSRAVKELESKDGTLTIKLYDGTSVNFTKAGFNALELRQEDPQNRGVWLYNENDHTYNVQKTVYAYNNNEYIGLYSTINETSGTEAYEDGFNDVGISGITRQTADSFTGGADYGTTVYIRVMASNGKTGTQSFRVSGENAYKLGVAAGEQAGYEDGYAAGWAAAKAAITVGGQITEIRNTAANTFFAQGRATAYLDDEAVATGTFGKSQVIQMGQ